MGAPMDERKELPGYEGIARPARLDRASTRPFVQLAFGLDKFNAMPLECRTCSYLKLCWGECPRTRILKTRDGEGPLSYLCQGWKEFFRQRLAELW
jgi:sulfatase maturation enzyme AslB (radical SAM superfamily)